MSLAASVLLGLLVLIILATFYFQGAFRKHIPCHLIGLPASTPHFATTLASMSDSHSTSGVIQHFWTEIDAIQTSRLRLIEKAQQSIQFETFIMTPGARADAFAEALCKRARAGVEVQLLADSYGANSLSEEYWRTLKQAGVDVRFFNPFSWRDPLTYLKRNHRKLLIVDQQIAMIGGSGISDWWDGSEYEENPVPWLDFEVQWQGEVIGFLTGLFYQHWLDAEGVVDLNQHQPYASVESVKHSQIPSSTVSKIVATPGEDPSLRDSAIRSLFQVCVLSAQERIWIASPYLLPDQTTCRMLCQIRQRGVDVRILTMGPRSDKKYVYYVSRERYGPLLKEGIKLHEYQPSMMHAKMVLIDRHWVSLGSANLDPRSYYHNDELNLCTDDSALIDQVADFFERSFEASQIIQIKEWRDRPLKERMVGTLSNILYWQL